MTKLFTKNKFSSLLIKGFTLVELLVVIGLFSSIATLSLGSLFNAQTINNRLQQTQSILDNVNLSVQTITRDIRFGSDFYCDTSLPATVPTVRKNCEYGTDGSVSGSVIMFRPADFSDDHDRVAYYISNGTLFKNVYTYNPTSSTYSSSTFQMTSDDVQVGNLMFYVEGAQTSDGSSDFGGVSDFKQPLITVLISGATKPYIDSVSPTPFSLQVSVSARDIDNK